MRILALLVTLSASAVAQSSSDAPPTKQPLPVVPSTPSMDPTSIVDQIVSRFTECQNVVTGKTQNSYFLVAKQFIPPMFLNFIGNVTTDEVRQAVQVAIANKDNVSYIEEIIQEKVPTLGQKINWLKGNISEAFNNMTDENEKQWWLDQQEELEAIKDAPISLQQKQKQSQKIFKKLLNRVMNNENCQEQISVAFPQLGMLINSPLWKGLQQMIPTNMTIKKSSKKNKSG